MSHATRLAGSPLTVGPVHSPGADSSMPSSYAEVPASMPRIPRDHAVCVPATTAASESRCPARRHVVSEPGSTRLPTEPS